MIARLDRFILERLYQPAANLAMRRFRRNCYRLAAQCAIGGCTLQGLDFTGAFIAGARRGDTAQALFALILVPMLVAYGAGLARDAKRLEACSLGTPARSPGARSLKFWGPAAVVFVALFGPDLYSAGAFLLFSYAYFMECSPAPPARRSRRSARMAEAVNHG